MSCFVLYSDLLEKMDLKRIVTPGQIAKKWDNLKGK